MADMRPIDWETRVFGWLVMLSALAVIAAAVAVLGRLLG